MATQKVIVTADSACDIPKEYIAKLNLPVIRSCIRTKGGVFLEGEEITTENVVEYAESTHFEPQIIPPSVEQYREFFEKALEKAPSVCHFSISSKLSRAFCNATEAALSLKNVFIIDSLQISAGIAFQVIQAAQLAAEGFDVPFIKKASAELQGKICGGFYAPDSEYRRKMKLTSQSSASMAELMGLTPVLRVKSGMVKKFLAAHGKCGSFKGIIKKEFGSRKNPDTELLFISCVNPNTIDIGKLKAEIEKYYSFSRICVTEVSPKVAVNMGPKVIGLHYLIH